MGQTATTFGRFVLTEEGLTRDGTPIAVGQRGLALLIAMARADGPVSKSDLMDAGWPGVTVEESNLTVQMAALRRRLGSSPRGEDWIATFPRVGYRFAGPFRRETPAGELPRTPAPRSPASPDGRPPIDLQAYELYVRGQSLLLQSPRGNRLARSYLLEAMQRQAANVPWTTGSASQDRSVATLSVSGNTLTLQLLAPLAIVWSSAAAADSETPAPTA